MSRSPIPILVFAAVVVSCLSVTTRPMLGQSVSLEGRIEGTVNDANGAAVSNVLVTAHNLRIGSSQRTSSNDLGRFLFPIISPGQYVITAEANGFKRFEQVIPLWPVRQK
jgi:hypothetical protein